ncbi:hemolysin III family protein [Pelagibius litoralis]|uniref:Hemolysin III family protein n=1 Tax=Pelagibius litoralis TaxID=374515 RepID=A0A967KBF5_9PROT|nr:hemolysin III family protein [Pelagibius litoralis]NIA71052.1 hemolysin III family protein [Pelagibius litoralis]
MPEPLVFPTYASAERRADAAVHVLGVGASLIAFPILILLALPQGSSLSILSLAVYGTGLIAVFACSAAYNMAKRPGWKEILRRLDHAAIFVMIAGTYTPFSLIVIGGGWGLALLAAVWVVALAGVALKLFLPRRFERAAIALYLAQGWAILAVVEPLVAALSTAALVLLVTGGGLYTLGVVSHLWRRLPYHNAIWHALVLAAAGCHYAAILEAVVLTLPVTAFKS